MNGYQFVASLVQSLVSLAWPAALIFCVWLFRGKVIELLPHLQAKYKGLEFSFRLEKAEKETKALPATVGAEPELTPEEESRFEQIAKLSPRAAILEYRAELDQALREFAQAIGMTETSKPPLGRLISALRESGSIDIHTSKALDDLRVLGNAAAHGDYKEISEAEASRFGKLAERLIKQLRISTGAAATLGQPAPLPPSRD
jgi:Domain of unknown function (DUF4145)